MKKSEIRRIVVYLQKLTSRIQIHRHLSQSQKQVYPVEVLSRTLVET